VGLLILPANLRDLCASVKDVQGAVEGPEDGVLRGSGLFDF
jgi:hypothetical protein